MDTELILALVGVAFAGSALGALSVVRQARVRREKREKRGAAEQSTGAPLKPFFVAQYRGSKARFFRVYPDEDDFLFVHAGSYLIMVDAEVVRGTDRRHRVVLSTKLLAAGLALGAAIAGAVLFVTSGEGAGSVPYAAIALGTLLVVGLAAALPVMVWRIAQRANELDALSPDGLRAEAGTELGFRADHDSISAVKFALLEVGGDQVGATLTFRHKPTGTWTIETTTTRDTRAALDEFYDALGDLVAIDDALRERLDWHTDEDS
jgi:hypothetical protein